ncbi:MAG: hypothetical protein ACXAB0_12615 [Candidatus Thorarchaeota archaeon]
MSAKFAFLHEFPEDVFLVFKLEKKLLIKIELRYSFDFLSRWSHPQ